MTMFLMPFGRYRFKILPFGISSAPEFFQRKMSQFLDNLEGVVCNIDDILIYGRTQAEHNARLRVVLEWLQNVTLNREKCEFNVQRVKFLGHIVDKQGIRTDPSKVQVIIDMRLPSNAQELRRFLRMANYVMEFVPNISEIAHPMNTLPNAKSEWVWPSAQPKGFELLKKKPSESSVLSVFDPENITVVLADASSFGLGAVLRQKQKDGVYRPVAYASRSLSETERRYAQIEKEGLAGM